MKFSKFNLYIFMLVVGFFCIVVDLNVNTPLQYPHEYQNTKKIIGEFQYYNIASNYHAYCDYRMIYGDGEVTISDNSKQNYMSTQATVINNIYYKNLQVDCLNDFAGFLLILIACLGLKKCSRLFSFGSLTALGALIIHGLIVSLPFYSNGLTLCYTVFFVGTGYLITSLLTLYFVINGLFKMCPDISCRDERRWGRMIWYVIFVLQILTTFVFWIGADFHALHTLGLGLEIFNALMVLLFWRILFRATGHIRQTYLNTTSQNSAE